MFLYKEENIQGIYQKSYENRVASIQDETWVIDDSEFNDSKIPDNPDDFIQYIRAQSIILANLNAKEEERIEAVKILDGNLNDYKDFTKFIFFNEDTLYSLQDLMMQINPSFMQQTVSLIKLLVIKLPNIENDREKNRKNEDNFFRICLETKLIQSIISCLFHRISFSIASDLIDIWAILASFGNEKIFEEMSRCGVVSRVCDLLSAINNQIAPSREEESLNELPFIAQSINLESHFLYFPLLVFSFHFLNWDGAKNSIKSEELMEHLIGILSIQLQERELCCLLNTLKNISSIDSIQFSRAIQRMGLFENINKIFDIASELTGNAQVFALQTILNLAYNDDSNNLLNDKFLKKIFEILNSEEVCLTLKESCFIIIQYMSYNACHYLHKHQKSINVVKTFRLPLLKRYYDDGSFSIRYPIGHTFIYLIENRRYCNEIFNNIDFNILDIFIPLILTGDSDCIIEICSALINLIDNPDINNMFKSGFCNSIKQDGFLEAFDDPSSCDPDAFQHLKLLEKRVDDVIKDQND